MFNSNFKPSEGETYYFIITKDRIMKSRWYNLPIDIQLYNIGNCFKTKEDAKFAYDKSEFITKLRRFADENKRGFASDSLHDIYYIILLNKKSNKVFSNMNGISSDFIESNINIKFPSKDIADKAIETFGENDIKKYLFGI